MNLKNIFRSLLWLTSTTASSDTQHYKWSCFLCFLYQLFLMAFLWPRRKESWRLTEAKRFKQKKPVQPHLEATQQKFLEKTCSATFRSHPAPNIAGGDVRQYLAVQLWWLTCLGGFLAFLLEFYTFFLPDPIMVGWFVQLWLLVWVLSCFFCYCPLLNKVVCVIIGVTEITTII